MRCMPWQTFQLHDVVHMSLVDTSATAKEAAPTLSEKAYRQLEEMIVNLELAPGSVLSEQVLSQRLGIGRTPIREALHRLIREGLVVSYPSRGLVISEINQQIQLRLLEVRREMDRLMARLAAERANARERAQFLEIADGMRASVEIPDYALFMRHDKAFNQLIAEAAKNEFALKTTALMQGLWSRFWNRYYEEVGDVPLVARLHAAIAEAIARRDAQAAAAASDRLIDYIEDFTRRTLDA